MKTSVLSASLAVVALLSETATAQTIGCEAGVANGGLVPASGTGGGGGTLYPNVLPPFASIFPLNVTALPLGATCVTEVKFTGLAHTWTDDLHLVLQDPGGGMTNLWVRPGVDGELVNGNVYSVVPLGTSCNTFPVNGIAASAAYTQQFGDAGQVWPSGTNGIHNTDLSLVPAQVGAWNLILYDWAAADVGSVVSWDLCFGTPTPPLPPCNVPVPFSPSNAANVNGAYVALSWNPVLGAASYDVDVDGIVTNVAGSPFQYFSAAGGHTWTVRAVNGGGATVYSTPRSFTDIGLAAPALSTPANGSNLFGPNVRLSWAAVNQASGYDVDVDGVVTTVSGTSFVFNSTPGVHNWRVRASWNAGALVGPYTAARTFNDLGAVPGACTGTTLPTLFAQNNAGSVGGIVYFDIDVTNPAGITLSQLDTNTSLAVASPFGMDIYMKPGTSVGFESNAGAWTLMASGGGFSLGTDQPSVVEFPDFNVATGVSGVALVLIGAGHRYTNGTGANQFYSNADLSITCGKADNAPWGTNPFSPRVWNGTLRYDCGGAPPVSYCTAGTSTNGCAATITADNQPSISQANSCNLSVANVEGQKSGLIFYGLAQLASPWGTGSTSFLCVKAPSQRTTTQSSGGTAGLCDGTLTLDLNAYLTANPGALGQPFAAGNKAYAQAWYRDPPAPKTTNLSDGVELTFQP